MNDVPYWLNEKGPLAQALEGFRVREQQMAMATAIDQAITNKSLLIVEAGTGTGKTYAYLVPALLSSGKVIISTGTKTLQDQLFHRDLPFLREVMKLPIHVALLKGRANYLCHYYLNLTLKEGRLRERHQVRQLNTIKEFAGITQTGDKSECQGVPENAPIWSQVTSTRDNCLGQDCPHQSQCYVLNARKKAAAADFLVVNHHLFFADIMLRDEGVAELLPNADTVVLDEAHHLPDVATLFFGQSVSTAQWLELARQTLVEGLALQMARQELEQYLLPIEKALRDLRLLFGQREGKLNYESARAIQGFTQVGQQLLTLLGELNGYLAPFAGRTEGFDVVISQWHTAEEFLSLWLNQEQDNSEAIRWCDCFSQSMQLHYTPLSIAELFREEINRQAKAWIFTSATLAMKGDFSHFQRDMGLEEAITHCWDSPFKYQENALLYVPQQLPQPQESHFTEAVIEAAKPVLLASRGRAFLLFTTHRALLTGAELIREWLQREGLEFPCFVQGEQTKIELLDQFRQSMNGILCATHSFWEGVDVKGEALSLVIIDKLPFQPPDDPVTAARLEAINRTGGNAFMDYQLPKAVITLKQGAGRLIRDEEDKGVLMICDPRLIDKSYGRRIWMSLPAMKRTRSSEEAIEFLSQC
ncbi:putative ATP-dependent helicase DinG [Ferrovum sp. JA12]|uniref:ATP-dependent DNA helicase n=1 Tax=Ferrovum sp. JA12 TaxID=1356299 RepID=UPI00070361BA|nr:ATP-dependent DNA helicase [Ferrovum sp. JA12]KRH78547.1 putative ATP-dependent helicase DinG [Ferrovum sp. JA12]